VEEGLNFQIFGFGGEKKGTEALRAEITKSTFYVTCRLSEILVLSLHFDITLTCLIFMGYKFEA